MFTSYHNNNNNNNNNSCDNNMVVVDDADEQNMFDNRPFENDISPNYKPDNLSFSFFHFSPATTFFDQDDAFLQYHNHLLQQSVVVNSPADSNITTTMAAENQTQTTKMATASDNNDPSNEPNNKTMKTANKSTSSTKKIPKRRLAGKKDRHSKIVTAQGPRDRRMRLSLPIAREFFSLQDMLGVDKPSKTVQWLLTKSKSAIEELTISLSQRRNINNKYHSAAAGTGSGSKSTTTGSPMSECEVVSQIEETSVGYNQKKADHDRRSADFSKRKSMESSPSSPSTPTKGKKIKPSRKITCQPLARESRAKARARARERTIKKTHSQSKQCVQENLNNDLKKVRSLTITSKEGEESAGSGTYDMKSTLELVSTDEVMKHSSPSMERQSSLVKDNINAVDLEESFMITTRKASSSSIFSYHGDIGLIGNSNNNNNNSTSVLNFSEMWDFTNNAGQTNLSYCAIADMNLPAGNIQEYCLPTSSSIPLASPNTRLQSQFANLPLFCGKP